MPAKAQKNPLLNDGEFIVEKVVELNFFDMTGAKAKTKGTSNKSYHAELQFAKSNNKAQIYTMWGPTGGKQTKDWRHYTSKDAAEKDFAAILKSKKRKGYQEIDVAQRALGSEAAKQITKAVDLKNADITDVKKSSLHKETQKLIKKLMGATNQFVITTLRCPIGQLSNEQVEIGRQCLQTALKILKASKHLSKNDTYRLEELTNKFYGAIPHNLGSGSRGKMTDLLLDSEAKILKKNTDLDTLLDAKAVGAVLSADTGVDAQYCELNADLTFINHDDPLFKFVLRYLTDSSNPGHGFGVLRLRNLWQVNRKDRENEFYLENAARIAKEYGKNTFAKEARDLSHKDMTKLTPQYRPDLGQKECDIFNRANVWLCWHGTRSANICGITKQGLLVRPKGVVHTGSMFGDGKYFAWQSTKSLNYCDGGYYTGGNATSRYMFLMDVALGRQHIANGAYFYKGAPSGYHSVYGKAHKSHVWNDEMITYDFSQKTTQSRIRYLLEIA